MLQFLLIFKKTILLQTLRKLVILFKSSKGNLPNKESFYEILISIIIKKFYSQTTSTVYRSSKWNVWWFVLYPVTKQGYGAIFINISFYHTAQTFLSTILHKHFFLPCFTNIFVCHIVQIFLSIMLYKHFCLPYCTHISIYFVVHTFLFTMLSAFSGEGIHHAMEGGKLVAMFLDEVITQGNYDNSTMHKPQSLHD